MEANPDLVVAESSDSSMVQRRKSPAELVVGNGKVIPSTDSDRADVVGEEDLSLHSVWGNEKSMWSIPANERKEVAPERSQSSESDGFKQASTNDVLEQSIHVWDVVNSGWEDQGHHEYLWSSLPALSCPPESLSEASTLICQNSLSSFERLHSSLPSIQPEAGPIHADTRGVEDLDETLRSQDPPGQQGQLGQAGEDFLEAESAHIEEAVARLQVIFPEVTGGGLPEDFPKFQKREVVVGNLLGRGGFSDVKEISRFEHSQGGAAAAGQVEESREFVSKRCQSSWGEARYAVKHLTSRISKDPQLAWTAMIDLVVETRILASLEHPHIIKLRAVGDEHPFTKNFFIILDRLSETLKSRIQVWKTQVSSKRGNIWTSLANRKRTKVASSFLWKQRLSHAYHLASAMGYLHQKNLIHRDLKSDNVGFDLRGDIKIFDFGMARLIESRDEVYHMTEMTGSLRYMAPEVAQGEKYNHHCDVYSFTLLLWEMLTLQRPYNDFPSPEAFLKKVAKQQKRPKIPRWWPQSLKQVVKTGWHGEQSRRLEVEDFSSQLKELIFQLDGSIELNDGRRRRSTHVYKYGGRQKSVLPVSKHELSQWLKESREEGDSGSLA